MDTAATGRVAARTATVATDRVEGSTRTRDTEASVRTRLVLNLGKNLLYSGEQWRV